MPQCASPCERCFVCEDIQLFRIPRELWSIYSCCCCEQTNPTGQVWSLRHVLSPPNQPCAKAKLDHPCDFSCKLPGTRWTNTCNSCLVVRAQRLPGQLFPQRNKELPPPDKPFPVCRREAAPAADGMSKGTLQPPGYTEVHRIRRDASRSAEGAGWHHLKASITFLKGYCYRGELLTNVVPIFKEEGLENYRLVRLISVSVDSGGHFYRS